jgi:hypothetical protein
VTAADHPGGDHARIDSDTVDDLGEVFKRRDLRGEESAANAMGTGLLTAYVAGGGQQLMPMVAVVFLIGK